MPMAPKIVEDVKQTSGTARNFKKKFNAHVAGRRTLQKSTMFDGGILKRVLVHISCRYFSKFLVFQEILQGKRFYSKNFLLGIMLISISYNIHGQTNIQASLDSAEKK